MSKHIWDLVEGRQFRCEGNLNEIICPLLRPCTRRHRGIHMHLYSTFPALELESAWMLWCKKRPKRHHQEVQVAWYNYQISWPEKLASWWSYSGDMHGNQTFMSGKKAELLTKKHYQNSIYNMEIRNLGSRFWSLLPYVCISVFISLYIMNKDESGVAYQQIYLWFIFLYLIWMILIFFLQTTSVH